MIHAKWAKLKEKHDAEQAGAKAMRDTWPEICSIMAELRDEYPADREFGAALVMHGIEYTKDDRAAYVYLGRQPANVLEDAMAMNLTASIEVLARWVKEHRANWEEGSVSEIPKPASEPQPSPEKPVNDAHTGNSEITAVGNDAPSEPQTVSSEFPNATITKNHKLAKTCKGNMVMANAIAGVYRAKSTRTSLADLKLTTLKHIYAGIREGYLPDVIRASTRQTKRPNEMLTGEPVPLHINTWVKWIEWKRGGSVVPPALADANSVSGDDKEAARAAGQAALKAAIERNGWDLSDPHLSMPKPITKPGMIHGEETLVWYGATVWDPNGKPPHGAFSDKPLTYTQVLGVIWMLDDMKRSAFGHQDDASAGLCILHLVPFLRYQGAETVDVIHKCAGAMNKNPTEASSYPRSNSMHHTTAT